MSDTPPFAFDRAGYAGMIRWLLDRGYRARDYETAGPRGDLVLRHDIDQSLDAAVVVAGAERGIGVTATYFVLLRTDFYNCLSRSGLAALREIAANGHRIGLHFDAALYPDDSAALDAACRREIGVLESMSGLAVRAVSLHRPAASLVGAAPELGGLPNAYAARYVSEMGYCSDSRGEWRHGPPWSHPAVRDGRSLHLLTHPLWWYGPAVSPQERLHRFLDDRRAALDTELSRHVQIHKPGTRN